MELKYPKRQIPAEQCRGRGPIIIAVIAISLIIVFYGAMDYFQIFSRCRPKIMIVLSGSMHPTLEEGDMLIVSEDPRQFEKGDIICFKDPQRTGRTITHRIIAVLEETQGISYITKGDANQWPDQLPVPADHVIGRVSGCIPLIGKAVTFSQSNYGLIVLLVLPGTLMLIKEVYGLVS